MGRERQDPREHRSGGGLPGRGQRLVSAHPGEPATLCAQGRSCPRAGRPSPRARGRPPGAAGPADWRETQPQDDIYLVAAPFTLYRRRRRRGEAQVWLRSPDPALAAALSGRHRGLPGPLQPADRPLPLCQVRPGGELLGDRLRHALLHPAGPPGHPPALHHRHLLSPRDPAQLVGQRRLCGLRHGQLERGPDRLSGGPSAEGARGPGRRLPPRQPQGLRGLCAHGRGLPAHGSAAATARPARRSATARR